MDDRHIRPVALCVFRRADRILLARGYDPTKREHFLRPIGGALEFGETALDALRREMREELRVEITNPRLLGVLENIFTYDGGPGHEIVFVFDAQFDDARVYDRESVRVHEGGWDHGASWLAVADLKRVGEPVYPSGLIELLHQKLD